MSALDLLGRRWTLRIIWELHQEAGGFRDLQRRCDQMSSSVLSTRITELVEAGIVVGDAEGYHLTPLGEALLDALNPLESWSKRWAKAVR